MLAQYQQATEQHRQRIYCFACYSLRAKEDAVLVNIAGAISIDDISTLERSFDIEIDVKADQN
jgi:hypothetical protein